MPFTSFREFNREAGGDIWFALGEERTLASFAGLWTTWTSVRKVRDGEVTADLFGFLTTNPNAEVGAIHPKAMPVILTAAEQIERSTLVVLPQDRSGVIVHFPVHSFQGALVRLTDEAGKPLPPGSRVTVEGATARPQEIGFGGEAFLTGLQAHNRVIAIQPDGQACHAKFDLHPKRHWLPKIGPIPCLATAA